MTAGRLLSACVAFALLLVAAPSFAAEITVAADCVLADAITAANTDKAVGGCVAGAGADVITLSEDVTLAAELPRITSEITVAGGGFSISGAAAYRIFSVEASGTLTIERLTLRDARSGPEYTPGIVHGDGGAIYNEGLATISDSAFNGNKAGSGGAIANLGRLEVDRSTFVENNGDLGTGAINNLEDGEMHIRHSIFVANSGYDGGAIGNSGALRLADTQFTENDGMIGGAIHSRGEAHILSSSFDSNFAGRGGAILNLGEQTIIESQFSGNRAAQIGGAILNDGDITVRRSVFARSSAFWGGAINNGPDGALRLEHSVFRNNAAAVGAAIENRGAVWVDSSEFSGNSAQENGGAIHERGQLRIENSSFSENRAVNGGALYVVGNRYFSTNAALTHVTLVANVADIGGGVYVDALPEAAIRVYRSILADNAGGDCVGGLTHSASNLIADGTCDADLTDDPMLGDLVEPDDGRPAYFPLLPGSPAIDAASGDHCPDSDQIGTPRPQGEACDIGAIEFVSEQQRDK